jgi:erythromycin esterase-like protein
MKPFNKLSLAFLFLTFSLFICRTNNISVDYYNLNLDNSNGWKANLSIFKQEQIYDSLFNRMVLCVIRLDSQNLTPLPMIGGIERFLMLPDSRKKGDCKISVIYKTENPDNVFLKVNALDEKGNEIYIDSIRMDKENEWAETPSLKFSDKRIKFLRLGIFFEPKDENATHPKKLWLDKINLQYEGLDMANLSSDMLPLPKPLDKAFAIPLDLEGNKDFSSLASFLKGKRIVSVGESRHGVKEYSKAATGLIKSQILHNNCRLVALEIPFSLGLKWNRYVNDITFDNDEVLDDMESIYFDTGHIIDFLLWLKEYNNQTDRKVRLFGMDSDENDELTSIYNRFHYFSTCLPYDSLLFSNMCMSSLSGDSLLLNVERNKDQLIFYLGEEEVNLLIKSLDPLLKVEERNNLSKIKFHTIERDRVMVDNLYYAIENLLESNETVTIWGHLIHSTKKYLQADKVVSLGEQLSDYYGDNHYYSIGLISSYDDYIEEKISDNFPDSILSSHNLEMAAANLNIPYFFYPINQLDSKYQKLRLTLIAVMTLRSEIYHNEFIPLDSYMDAFIYINNPQVINKDKDPKGAKDKQFEKMLLKISEIKRHKKNNNNI